MENRKSAVRGMNSDDDVAIENNTTAASRPWNLSTVPTSTPRVAGFARNAASTQRR